jgi:hypothetical protein
MASSPSFPHVTEITDFVNLIGHAKFAEKYNGFWFQFQQMANPVDFVATGFAQNFNQKSVCCLRSAVTSLYAAQRERQVRLRRSQPSERLELEFDELFDDEFELELLEEFELELDDEFEDEFELEFDEEFELELLDELDELLPATM